MLWSHIKRKTPLLKVTTSPVTDLAAAICASTTALRQQCIFRHYLLITVELPRFDLLLLQPWVLYGIAIAKLFHLRSVFENLRTHSLTARPILDKHLPTPTHWDW